MASYEIPLEPYAQSFSIMLGGVSYRLAVYWNVPGTVWVIDLMDDLGTPIITGIPLVANIDLLAPYTYMNFGGQLVAQSDNNPDAKATYDNLGLIGHLYFITP